MLAPQEASFRLNTIFYGVSPAEPLTHASASADLILAAALASYLPARKVTNVDPREALQTEYVTDRSILRNNTAEGQ